MSAIFIAFDLNRDGLLDRQELTSLIQQCNPSVELTGVQLDAIILQVKPQQAQCPVAWLLFT